jgi:uncharacterized protein YcbK (DUF882 family)
MTWTRRQVLAASFFAAGASAAGVWARPAQGQEPPVVKRLALRNLHTTESLEVEFLRGDVYVQNALAAIRIMLRDCRSGEQHSIDPRLLDYLHDAALTLGVDPVFSVISGYRSPQGDGLERERGSGESRRSLHLEGRAVDVHLAGVDCADFAKSASALHRGGVGYYRTRDFVHLDTGAIRTWRG